MATVEDFLLKRITVRQQPLQVRMAQLGHAVAAKAAAAIMGGEAHKQAHQDVDAAA